MLQKSEVRLGNVYAYRIYIHKKNIIHAVMGQFHIEADARCALGDALPLPPAHKFDVP